LNLAVAALRGHAATDTRQRKTHGTAAAQPRELKTVRVQTPELRPGARRLERGLTLGLVPRTALA
jgi:hypothetical protein